MLREACFVWNHTLALLRRYYRMYGRYVNCKHMKAHFARNIKRTLLHSQSTQKIHKRLDTAYRRFFGHLAKRSPKFRQAKYFSSVVFKQGSYSLNGNVLTVNSIRKRIMFSFVRMTGRSGPWPSSAALLVSTT